MAKTESHIPKLRFAGFTDLWQRSNFKTIFQIKSGTTPSRGNSNFFENGDINWIKTTDLNNSVLHESSEKVTSTALLESGLTIYPPNTIYLAMYGGFNQIGRVALMVNESTCNQALSALLPNKYIAPKFLLPFLVLSTNKWKRFAASSRKDPNITKSDVESFIFQYPILEEQIKIGDFFQKIDQVIELQQKVLETAQDYKKSMLQKMFPQKGEKVPKVRFDGFSGDWEIFKFLDTIEDVIDFRGRTPLKIGLDWSDDNNGYLALSALNVKQGYIDFDVDAHYGNDELYQKWMSGKELRKGQVLFTTEAPMGNVAQVPDNRGYILSQRTIAFITKKLIITDDFLACLLRSHQVVKELQSLASGGTATGVSQRSLSRLKIQIPKNIEEQRKIGAFFQKLDQQIAQHEKKLESYQSLKKAMLQRMFV